LLFYLPVLFPGEMEATCPSTYSLTVKAFDCGFPNSLSSTTTVNIRVHAINRYNPVFVQDITFPAPLLQSAPVGTSVSVFLW